LGMNVANEYGVKHEVSVRRLAALLERLKRSARLLARSEAIARDARKLARSAARRFKRTSRQHALAFHGRGLHRTL